MSNSTAFSNSQYPLTPNLDEADRFLAILDPRQDAQFAFRACADRCTDIIETRKCLGSLDHGVRQSSNPATNGRSCRPAKVLQERQQTVGAGVYVVINKTDGLGQTAENIVAIRALFCDADNKEQVRAMLRFARRIPPAAIIASGGLDGNTEKLQGYWPVEGCPVAEFTDAQRLLITRTGTDPSVVDPPRLMREPGFYHLKDEPRQTRIVAADPSIRYEFRDLLRRINAQPMVAGVARPVARAATTTTVVGHRGRAAAYPATARLKELIERHNGFVRPAVRELVEEVGKAGHGRHDAVVVVAGRLVGLGWSDERATEFLAPLVNEHFWAGDVDVERAVSHARRKEKARLSKVKTVVWSNSNV